MGKKTIGQNPVLNKYCFPLHALLLKGKMKGLSPIENYF